MTILRTGFLSFSLVLGLVACGGGGGSSSGPLSADEAQDICERGCQHEADCGDTTPVAECTTECVAQATAAWVRGDAFEDISECALALACTATENNCLQECSPTSAHNTYEAQCREVFAPCVTEPAQLDNLCEVTPASTGSDDVGFFCVINSNVIGQMTDCIPDGTTCQAGSECIQGVLEANGIDG